MAKPTEKTPTAAADGELQAARERFVSLWGKMGSSWGIPRTMAEVHALLFIVGRPMNTDEVMAGLGISRGNASMTMRSLVEWGIVGRPRALQRQSSDDHIRRVDRDARVVLVADVDGRPPAVIDPVTVGCARLGDR